MDDALLRKVASLQAKSLLLDEQSEVLTELTDMQALRGFKSDLDEYIIAHAQKGSLPPNPLAEIKERLHPIIRNLDQIRVQESAIRDLAEVVFHEQAPAVSLQFLEEAHLNIDTLPKSYAKIFEESLVGDWDGQQGERRVNSEIRECAAVLFPDKNLQFSESSKSSIQDIDRLSQRIVELKELHVVHSAIAAEASNLMKRQDFRSAISLLKENKLVWEEKDIGENGHRKYSPVGFKDISQELSLTVSEINDLAETCYRLRTWNNEVVAGRILINSVQNKISVPDGEFSQEVTPLVAHIEEQLRITDAHARIADARAKKRKHMLWAAVVPIVGLAIAIAFIKVQASRQAALEEESVVERKRISVLASARDEFRETQVGGGKVAGWGSNTFVQSRIPEDVGKRKGVYWVVQVAAGGMHSLALTTNGKVVAWGRNSSGQTSIPEGLNDVVQIAAGAEHSLALKQDSTVVAWGNNDANQTNVPEGLNDVVQIAAGAEHSLALKKNGMVVAWGRNGSGQTTIPEGLNDVVQIAAGAENSLALRKNGFVAGWGNNSSGQTNLGPINAVQIAAGSNHSLALIRTPRRNR